MTELEGLLGRLAAAFERAGVPFMVAGSFASTAHGLPRSTQDIDVVIDPDGDEALDALLRQFPTDAYYVDVQTAHDALRRRSMFNVVDHTSGWKIDFILRKNRPFSREEFARRTAMTLLGVDLFVATPEDTVVAKLEWSQQSGGSERQRRRRGHSRDDGRGIGSLVRRALGPRLGARRGVARGTEDRAWLKGPGSARPTSTLVRDLPRRGRSSATMEPAVHAFEAQARDASWRRRGARRATTGTMRLPLVFLHNQSGEDVFRAMRALRATRRCEESVVLSLTLVHEIRTVIGLAEPHDDTVVLLRPEHVKPPRVPSRWSRFARTFGCFL